MPFHRFVQRRQGNLVSNNIKRPTQTRLHPGPSPSPRRTVSWVAKADDWADFHFLPYFLFQSKMKTTPGCLCRVRTGEWFLDTSLLRILSSKRSALQHTFCLKRHRSAQIHQLELTGRVTGQRQRGKKRGGKGGKGRKKGERESKGKVIFHLNETICIYTF